MVPSAPAPWAVTSVLKVGAIFSSFSSVWLYCSVRYEVGQRPVKKAPIWPRLMPAACMALAEAIDPSCSAVRMEASSRRVICRPMPTMAAL